MRKHALVLAVSVAAAMLLAIPAGAVTRPGNWFGSWQSWLPAFPVFPSVPTTPLTPAPATAPTTATTAAPAPAPAPTPAPAPSTGLNADEQALANALNNARVQNGLKPLAIDANLQRAARDHAQNLLDTGAFTHDSIKNGTSYPFGTWIYWYYSGSCAGENIAWGSPSLSADQATTNWLNSPPHRQNLLSTSYTKMGVAPITQNGKTMAVNDFGC